MPQRPAADRGGPAHDRDDRLGRHGRPLRRRRIRGDRQRLLVRDRGRPGGRGLPAPAVASLHPDGPRSDGDRQYRHRRLSQAFHHRVRTAAGRFGGDDVLEGGGPQPVPFLRSDHAPPVGRAPDPGKRAAARYRPRRIAAALPAAGRHPHRGLVPPGQFIPIAEQTGLIVPLGEWVLRRACMDLKRMEKMGIDSVRVGVNVSPHQFERDIVGAMRQALTDSGVTPHLIDVEITESTLINDPERVIEDLTQLKALGIHISLDDFGTGFSSLSYLKRFPADTLKVDRSFVIELAENPKDEAIANAIIALAHSMGMTALAEGVEEMAQYEVLRLADCDVVQGYLFSTAMSFDDVVVHLQRGTLLLPENAEAAAH